MGILEYILRFELKNRLDDLVDDSDPDVAMPNSIHDYMTAERLREAYPDDDWLHLVGLLHDVGKVLALWGEPQWATVGDTFVTGCKPSEKCVHFDSFAGNPDVKHEVYGTEYGIYEPNCGLDKLWLSFGHDEYMYWILKENGATIPQEGLDIIRYHSFYPWHTGNAYTHLTNEHDETVTRKWVHQYHIVSLSQLHTLSTKFEIFIFLYFFKKQVDLFNKFDLYSKADEYPDIEKCRPYYEVTYFQFDVKRFEIYGHTRLNCVFFKIVTGSPQEVRHRWQVALVIRINVYRSPTHNCNLRNLSNNSDFLNQD